MDINFYDDVAILIGSYFPHPNWGSRIPFNIWFEHFINQTPNANKCRIIISDSGSSEFVKNELNKLKTANVEVYLDNIKYEMFNFKHLVSKLKNEKYILYIANDMIIRNTYNEDWLLKGIDILNTLNPLAYSIFDGLNFGNDNWDYKSNFNENLYEIKPFSTRFMLMKRDDVDKIDWGWLEKKITETSPPYWEVFINEFFDNININGRLNHIAYKHDNLGSVSIFNYTEEKLNNYIKTQKFIPQNYF